jgi:hypothetical protein
MCHGLIISKLIGQVSLLFKFLTFVKNLRFDMGVGEIIYTLISIVVILTTKYFGSVLINDPAMLCPSFIKFEEIWWACQE